MQLENFKSLIQEKFSFPFTKDQEKLLKVLYEFFFSRSLKKTIVLNGYAGTGKNSII